MKSWLIGAIVLVICGLLILTLQPSTPLPEPKNDTVVFFGDSLVEGYGATTGNTAADELSRLLGKPVINEGVSGDTTALGLARINDVVAHDAGLVIVLLGGNDALQKKSIEETEQNVRTIIETLQAKGSAVMLVGIRSGPFTDQYDDMFETLRNEYGLLYLPDALKGLFARPEYMSDPIHPNDAGYAILAERVYEVIKDVY